MEENPKERYRVVKSRSRLYRSANNLKGLYSFNALLLGVSFLISAIPTILLLLNFVKQSSGSILQFIAGLGLAFFFSLTLSNLIALLVNVAIIYLLSLGIRKDWPILTGAISILTATAHILILAFYAFCLILIVADSKDVSMLSGFTNFISTLGPANSGVLVLAIFVQTLIALYSIAFLFNGLGGFREAIVTSPLSTFFTSGILIEGARKNDVESMMKIYYAKQRIVEPEKNSYELWRKLMKRVDLENEVRVARVDEDIVGFLITSENFSKVKSVHLSGGALSNEAESCLLHDFIRLYSRSEQYVDSVEISSNDRKLQKALSHNGWEQMEKLSSTRRIEFRYPSSREDDSNSESQEA